MDYNALCTMSIFRLSELLKAEEEKYVEELSNMRETPLERQARMRERAKDLKEAREKERLALVEEKLEQKWRLLKCKYLIELQYA